MSREPYAFISYCHRNNDVVLPLIEKLSERGLRIWYDNGIEVGSEWPENIAANLSAASCVLAFMSPDSMESQNCRREINFAIDKKIDMVVAYIEPTELSLGMQLQLNTLQAIFKENYDNDDAFVDALLKASALQPCIEVPEPEPEPEPEPVVIPEVAPVAEPQPEPKPAPAPAPKPAAPKSAAPKPKKKGGKGKIIGIIAAVIVVVIIAVVAVSVSGKNDSSSSSGSSSSEAAPAPSSLALDRTPIADSRLVGTWKIEEVVNATDCDVFISSYGNLSINLNGSYFGDLFNNGETGDSTNPAGVVTIGEGTLQFPGAAEYLETQDFQITYEISTAEASEVESNVSEMWRPAYEGAQDTKLVVHITGSYQKSPTEIQDMDYTVTLIKSLPLWYTEKLLAPVLLGTWTDNYGNTWTFNTMDDYTMTSGDGTEYEGDWVHFDYDSEKRGDQVDFYFVDSSVSIPDATVVSVSFNKIEFTQKSGEPLVLTYQG